MGNLESAIVEAAGDSRGNDADSAVAPPATRRRKNAARFITTTAWETGTARSPNHERCFAQLQPFSNPYSLFPTFNYTASDSEVNVKSRIFIGGIIITNGDSSSPTRTGLPISSMLLSMITGDSLKRKFLIGYLISPSST